MSPYWQGVLIGVIIGIPLGAFGLMLIAIIDIDL